MKNSVKETILLVFVVLPYLYLATVWQQLPERVPTHFDLEGHVNGWSSKTFLLFFPGILGLGIYLLLLAVPILDPKKKIQLMGNKYFIFRLGLTIFNSLVIIYVLISASKGTLQSPSFILVAAGGLFAFMGNYFQTIRPNYFIGIRTPWTLESENVWRLTHLLGGRLWTAGGILIVILSLMKLNEKVFLISFGLIVATLVLIPIGYSYVIFQKEMR